MKTLLVCPKGNGNTFKVCAYISKNAGIDMKILTQKDSLELKNYDKIILGSGVYGGHPHKNLTEWIAALQKEDINPESKFYMLLTWFGRSHSDNDVCQFVDHLLNQKGFKLENDHKACLGEGFGIVRIGHPNNTEYRNMLEWVQGL